MYLCIYYAYSNIANFDYFLNAGYGYYNIDRYLTFFFGTLTYPKEWIYEIWAEFINVYPLHISHFYLEKTLKIA